MARVTDEVDAHGGILKADAAHLLVLFVGGLKILRPQGQVEFALAQVVLLGMVPQPGQLQTEVRLAVAQIDDDKAAVSGFLPRPHRLQAQGLLVKRQGLVQIGHVKIKMVE